MSIADLSHRYTYWSLHTLSSLLWRYWPIRQQWGCSDWFEIKLPEIYSLDCVCHAKGRNVNFIRSALRNLKKRRKKFGWLPWDCSLCTALLRFSRKIQITYYVLVDVKSLPLGIDCIDCWEYQKVGPVFKGDSGGAGCFHEGGEKGERKDGGHLFQIYLFIIYLSMYLKTGCWTMQQSLFSYFTLFYTWPLSGLILLSAVSLDEWTPVQFTTQSYWKFINLRIHAHSLIHSFNNSFILLSVVKLGERTVYNTIVLKVQTF